MTSPAVNDPSFRLGRQHWFNGWPDSDMACKTPANQLSGPPGAKPVSRIMPDGDGRKNRRSLSQAGLQVIGNCTAERCTSYKWNFHRQQLGIPDGHVLVGAADVMATSYAYGNSTGMLPYTVLVDNQGVIRWQFLGEIKRDELAALLEQVL